MPEPKYIYQCPNCDNRISRESLSSGNTIGAQSYSDGKMIAPMLPEIPSITICSKCNNIFWIDKAKVVAEIGPFRPFRTQSEENLNAEEARFLTIDEYLMSIDKKVFSKRKEEKYLRISLWQAYNDRVRDGKDLFKTETEKSNWLMNVNRLLELLNYENLNERIMIAELNRNLGNFEKCLEVIDSIESTDLERLKTQFKNECLKKNTSVFEINL